MPFQMLQQVIGLAHAHIAFPATAYRPEGPPLTALGVMPFPPATS
jgi:hypothetical protein